MKSRIPKQNNNEETLDPGLILVSEYILFQVSQTGLEGMPAEELFTKDVPDGKREAVEAIVGVLVDCHRLKLVGDCYFIDQPRPKGTLSDWLGQN